MRREMNSEHVHQLELDPLNHRGTHADARGARVQTPLLAE